MALLTPATEQRIEAFQRALAWGDHFRLLLVSAAPGPGRTEILQRLRAWSGRDGIPKLVELHLAAAERPVARIRTAAANLPPGTGIVLVGLDQHIARGEQATPAIRELNFFRDELPDVLPGPLVLVATPDAITNLLSTAPDLVSVRAFTLDVVAAAQRPNQSAPPLGSLLSGKAADVESLTAQLESLERRARPDPSEQSRLLIRLGMALYDADQYGPATERAHQALKLCRRFKQTLGEAHCLSLLGDIDIACAKPESAHEAYTAALRLYQKIDNRLGIAYSRIGLGKIALIRLNREYARVSFQTAKDICHELGAPQEAECSLQLGDLALMRVDYESASTHYEAALDLFHRSGRIDGEAHCIRGLGRISLTRGDLETARARFEEGLRLNRGAADPLGEAHGHLLLGEVASLQTDPTVAIEHLETARTIYQRMGDNHGLAHSLLHLGRLGHYAHEPALTMLRDAMDLYQKVGDINGKANAFASAAGILIRTGADPTDARGILREATAMYEKLADPLGKANCRQSLGIVELQRGRFLRARSEFREALRLYRRLDNKLGMANCLMYLGQIDLRYGTLEPATIQCSEALALHRKLGIVLGEAKCLHVLGRLAASRSEPIEAGALFEEAIKLNRQLGELTAIEQIERERDGQAETLPFT